MTLSTFLAFVGVSFILAVTPGPDTFLSLRYAMSGRRPGALAATGTSLAIFVWAALAAVGVAAALRSSDAAYYGLTLLGGCYLVYLGVRAVHETRGLLRPLARRVMAGRATAPARVAVAAGSAPAPAADIPADEPTTEPAVAVGTGGRGPLLAGITTCLTNPKTGLFFIALFPQFASPEMHVLQVTFLLGGTVAVILWIYLLGVVVLADAMRRWLARPEVTGAVQGVSGLVLGGLGVYMIATALLQLL